MTQPIYTQRVWLDEDGWFAFTVSEDDKVIVRGRHLVRDHAERTAKRYLRDIAGKRMGRTVRARNSKFNTTKSMV